MAKTLGGSLFVYNGLKHDYCLKESIESLKALCDEVVVLDAGSDDGSAELCQSFQDEKTRIICLPQGEFNKMKGKEKLSHFTNVAKSMLASEWHFNLQADEVIHEDSFGAIREAIELNNEGYFCTRINLWGNSQYQLNVDHSRSPVGTRIIRLAKTKYFSVDDAEGLYAPSSYDYVGRIRIYHMGFVRNKFVHTKKIEHMLLGVFGHNELDKKITDMDGVFNPFAYFSKDDLTHISEQLPKFVSDWAIERDKINEVNI